MRRSVRVIAIVSLLGTSSVYADNTDFHATANGSVATTDNKNGTETGDVGREASIFSSVRPGMLITYNAPRMIHELLAEVDFLYHLGSEKPSVTFRGGWKAFFITGPRSEMSVTADASMGQMNALSASSSPTETPTQVVPLGRVNTKQIAGAQNGSWQASKMSRTWQRTFSRYTTTDDNMSKVSTGSFEVGAGLGFDRQLQFNTFVFEVGASFLHLKRLDPLMAQPDMGDRLDRQLNPRAVFVWQYDISKKWSTNLDAGLVYVIPADDLDPAWNDPYNPDEDRKAGLFPIVGGIIAYTDVWGRAVLNVRRSVTPNLFIAQNTISDSVNLTAAMPLTIFEPDARKRAPKVVGIATLGVDRTQLIDPISSTLEGQFIVARIDLGVGWSPRPGQTYGLRYELAYQSGDTVAEMVVPTFFRNTFYFTFSLRWPEDIQVRVPRRNQSVRSDRKDLAPIGAEPVIVDPSEFLQEGGGER